VARVPLLCHSPRGGALGGLDNRVVRTAVEWVLGEQHESGLWGVGDGTAEETAYALDTLLAARASDPAVVTLVETALEQGYESLAEHAGDREHPSLWLGKGYTPVYVVQATIVGTLARLAAAEASSLAWHASGV
jgi:halimadienyl-diphosphate synthase